MDSVISGQHCRRRRRRRRRRLSHLASAQTQKRHKKATIVSSFLTSLLGASFVEDGNGTRVVAGRGRGGLALLYRH